MSILSSPLPEDIAQPAALVGFFQRLCDDGVKEPSICKLEALLDTISGLGSRVLELVPLPQLLKLQELARGILKRSPEFQTQLIALALLAKLSAYPARSGITQDGKQDELGALGMNSSPFDESHQFFDSRMATKTLNVAVVGCIQSSSSAAKLTRQELIRRFELAIEVCHSIQPHERARWVERNTPMIRKLLDKVSQLAQELCCVRLASTRFVASLVGIRSIPPGLISSLGDCLASTCPACAFEKGADLFDSLFCPDFLNTFLDAVVGSLESSPVLSYQGICLLDKHIILIRQLLASCRNRPSVTESVYASLCRSGFEKRIRLCFSKGTTLVSDAVKHCGNAEGPCARIAAVKRHYVQVDFCLLVSHCCILSMPLSENSRPLAIAAYGRLATLCDTRWNCPHDGAASTCASLQDFFGNNFGSEVTVANSSGDWKTTLLQDLGSAANEQYRLVVRRTAEVCQDLESRCENAEAPLRAERKITERLQQDLESTRAANTTLNTLATEQKSRISNLESEKSRLIDTTRVHQDEISALKDHIESLRQQLEATRSAAARDTHSLHEKLKDEELHHLSVVTAKDEKLEQKTREFSIVQSKLDGLDAVISRSESDNKDLHARKETLVQEKQALSTQVDREQHEIRRLEELNTYIQDKLATAQASVQNLEADKEETRKAAENKIGTLEKALSESGAKHREDIGAKNQEIEQEQRRSQQALEALKLDLARKKKARKAADESHQQREASLAGRLDGLQMERDGLLREAVKAREMRQRLFAAMGSDSSERSSDSTRPEQVTLPDPLSPSKATSLRNRRTSLNIPRNRASNLAGQAPRSRLSLGILEDEDRNRIMAGPTQTPHRLPRNGKAQEQRPTGKQPLEGLENLSLETIDDLSGEDEGADSMRTDNWDSNEEATLGLQVGIESFSTV